MAAGIEVPQKVVIHGYLLLGEHKMSKSLGNVIDPFQVADVYGPDALRFYLLREVSFGSDGEVSPEGFETRYTTELANEYGNLASRTLAMIERYRDGVVPERRAAGRARGRVRGPRRRASRDRIDEVELTRRARRDLAARRAAQPLRAGRGAVAARQGRGRGRRASTRCSTRWPRGCAWCRCSAAPFMPEARPSGCSRRSAARTARSTARGSGRSAGGAKVGELGQLFPRVEAEAPAA